MLNPHPDKVIEPKQGKNFHKKQTIEEPVIDDLDEAERDFIEKYKETDGDHLVLQKAVDQFGADRVKFLISKFIKKKVDKAPQ